MTYSTTAIILRRHDIGEWDRLYVAYTREHGKLTLLGKGTRRPTAKLAAHLEPFAEVDLVIAHGRSIDRIAFARTIRAHAATLRTYEDVRTAAFLAECTDQLTRDGHRDIALFDLLRDALLVIGHASAMVTTSFILRLLTILGYAPALDRCVGCRVTVAPGSAIGCPERGGIACLRCGASASAGIPLTAKDRASLASSSAQFSPAPYSAAITSFAEAHLACHLVAPLRTFSASATLTGDVAQRTMVAS